MLGSLCFRWIKSIILNNTLLTMKHLYGILILNLINKLPLRSIYDILKRILCGVQEARCITRFVLMKSHHSEMVL